MSKEKKPENIKKINVPVVMLAVLAAVLLLANLLPSELFLKYEKIDSGYAVTGYVKLIKPRRVTIPSEHKGEPVTAIAGNAFYKCESLTEITVPEGVTRIGSYAFRDCTELTSITLPDSLTSVGSFAFRKCEALTEVTIPAGVTSLDPFTFTDCGGLTSVILSDGLENIGDFALYCCAGLEEITIPASVKTIGKDAFDGCGITVKAPHEAEYYGEDSYSDVKKWIVI